jgi:outer membrane protein OmpA-like peptidoglycan-associated protein
LLATIQQASAQEQFYRAGSKYFEEGLYRQAIREFNNDQNASKNRDLLMKRMISYYESNNLTAAKSDISSLLSFRKKDDQLFLYIAKIYHCELNFDKAIEYYKEYLRRTPQSDVLRPFVISEIKRCASGLGLKYFDQQAFVENMGSDINSIYDEIDPVQSPNFLDRYYFSSNRPTAEGGRRNKQGIKDNEYGTYFLDMFSAELVNGKWSQAKPLNTLLNTAKHERILDFSTDGSVLYFLKGDSPDEAEIFIDTFSVTADEIYPPKFDSPVLGEKGDVYLHFYNDSTIVFASKRKGGYGGYDLYVCYQRNNYWSLPKNLGPNVNGPFDEVSPFVTNDGLVLYFSSNRLESMGGFDVFKTSFSTEDEQWTEPENLKIGINSASNDIYYRIAADGQSAYFSSDRKSGIGNQDLYKAYLKQQELGQLAYNPILPFLANDQSTGKIASNKEAGFQENGTEAQSNLPEDVKTKEFVLEPLFYGNDENLFTVSNQKNLDNIINILTIYPSAKIEIESHSLPESQIAYELYFSIKRAEKISEYLKEKGISEKRIMLRGFGANYPLVSLENSAQAGNLAERLNRRLEVKITNIENLPVKIEYNDPVVADFLKDPAVELYKTVNNGLSYRVFIARVGQMYQNEVLNSYQDAMIEKKYGGKTYFYTVGLYKNYFDAQDVLKELKKDNIQEASIIPYIDGEQMDTKKLMEFATQYPDLVNYLQYNGQ